MLLLIKCFFTCYCLGPNGFFTYYCCSPYPGQGPHQNRTISSKRPGVWSYWCVTFLSMYFPLKKVQFPQAALMYVAMATMQLFGWIWKTRISIVFQVFPPERILLGDNLLWFGHKNSLISSIKANIRPVSMETFQKILLPK